MRTFSRLLTASFLLALSLLALPAAAQTRLWIQSDAGDYIGPATI